MPVPIGFAASLHLALGAARRALLCVAEARRRHELKAPGLFRIDNPAAGGRREVRAEDQHGFV